MNNRHFHEGQFIEVGGVSFRVLKGKKRPGDLVMEWRTSQGAWVAFPMDVIFMLVDFLASNEDVLYPPPAKGGGYFMDRLKTARIRGWQEATAMLHEERARRDAEYGLFNDDEAA